MVFEMRGGACWLLLLLLTFACCRCSFNVAAAAVARR
jgi:hypothetical protein